MYSSRTVLYHKQIICPYVINLHIFLTCSQYFVYPAWENDLCVPMYTVPWQTAYVFVLCLLLTFYFGTARLVERIAMLHGNAKRIWVMYDRDGWDCCLPQDRKWRLLYLGSVLIQFCHHLLHYSKIFTLVRLFWFSCGSLLLTLQSKYFYYYNMTDVNAATCCFSPNSYTGPAVSREDVSNQRSHHEGIRRPTVPIKKGKFQS